MYDTVEVAEGVEPGDEDEEGDVGAADDSEAREERAGEAPGKKRHPFRRWLRKVFGNDEKGEKDRKEEEDGGAVLRPDPHPRPGICASAFAL